MNSADRKTLIAIVVIALAAPVLWFLLKDVERPKDVSPVSRLHPPPGSQPPIATPHPGANGTSVQNLSAMPEQPDAGPTVLEVASIAPTAPSFVLDVFDPAKARAALKSNAWLQQTMKQPLGEGFVGPWAGFFGSKGDDLGKAFKGEVSDVVADAFLSAPFRVVWFGGADATSTPVFVVPQAATGAATAFELMTRTAGHGVQTADRCPGEELAPTALPDGGAPKVAQGKPDAGAPKYAQPRHIETQRWVLADQALYVALDGGKLAFARNPTAVLQGLCAELPAAAHAQGSDAELTFDVEGLGHDAATLNFLLGIDDTPHLAFAIEGDHLVPRGISGKLGAPGRVDVAPLSDDLLKSLPVDVPVLFTAQLKLPAKLDPETLKAFFAEGAKPGPTVTRQVAVAWVPHGDSKATTEVAVLWSRADDGPALDAAFGGKNKLLHDKVCGQLVFASTAGLLQKLKSSCSGNAPNLGNAAGPIVAGLRAPASVGLQLQLGRILSGITGDAYRAETHAAGTKDTAPPKELGDAQQQLEQLPTFGFTGTAQGDALVAGGFHS